MDVKQRLVHCILDFLRSELEHGNLNSENVEGLEVAIQCLESIYGSGADSTVPKVSLLPWFQQSLQHAVNFTAHNSEEDKRKAHKLKTDGNNAMRQENYSEALKHYTEAILLDSRNAIYYCNRAAAFSKLQQHERAIDDCHMAIMLDPMYSKAYGRMGLAYTGLGNYSKAKEFYQLALNLDPENEGYRNNLTLAEQKLKQSTDVGMNVDNAVKNNGQTQNAAAPDGAGASQSGAGVNPGQGAPNIDFNSVFGNPQLINIASQMLNDPSVQQIMNNIITGIDGGSRGMDALLQAGQRLARHMHVENPELVDQLRNTMGAANCPNFNLGTDQFDNPDQDPDGNFNK